MNIIIIYNKLKDINGQNLKQLLLFLNKENINFVIDSSYKNINDKVNIQYDTNEYNLVITLGGDGTVMNGCKYALRYNIPIIGINIGHLGFLTQIDINNIKILKKFFSGNYITEERSIIESTINNKIYYAINDIVVARSEVIKLANLDLYCNFQKVSSYRADGLIVSTPTGSTAYSLAAGGPIVDLSINGLVFTPISSHSLKDRPIIFGKDKHLKIVSKSDFKLNISIDGDMIQQISKNEEVNIKVSNKTCKFINLDDRNYLKIFDNPIF